MCMFQYRGKSRFRNLGPVFVCVTKCNSIKNKALSPSLWIGPVTQNFMVHKLARTTFLFFHSFYRMWMRWCKELFFPLWVISVRVPNGNGEEKRRILSRCKEPPFKSRPETEKTRRKSFLDLQQYKSVNHKILLEFKYTVFCCYVMY